MRRPALIAVLVAVLVGGLSSVASTVDAAADVPQIALSHLDGATTPTSFTLAVDVPDATSAKLVVDGAYVGKVDEPPLTFDVSVTPGPHRLKVRSVVDGTETRDEVQFTAAGADSPDASTPGDSSTSSPGASSPGSSSPSGSSSTPGAKSPASNRSRTPSTGPAPVVAAREARRWTASPRSGPRWRPPNRVTSSTSPTASTRSSLDSSLPPRGRRPRRSRCEGSRKAVLRTKNASGDYGLSITGDYWHVEGLTVAHGSKGIVLDGSVGTVLDGVEVFDIGAEGVHFRACSSDGVLRNSYIHDTGIKSPQYGEGVYVGSANSNWSKYQCTDATEGKSTGDNSERVLIEHNVFENITAEGADLKEGTDSGTLRDNEFRHAGISGLNSADSAVDAKGDNWLIEGNTVSDTGASWEHDGATRPSKFNDGFQSHSVYNGYGNHNVFRANRVDGAIPGFGIGLYPKLGNEVTCDNVAPGAAKGLVGDNSKPAACQG